MQRLLPTLAYMQTRLHEPLSLDQLASRTGKTVFQFHQAFRSAIGQNFVQYAERCRLERAAFLLAMETRPTVQIAQAVGMDDAQVFSRAFGRLYGVGPAEFRRSMEVYAGSESGGLRDGLEESLRRYQLSQTNLHNLRELHLACTPFTGAYGGVPPSLWDRLLQWKQSVRDTSVSICMGIGHDSPVLTGTQSMRFDACVTVSAPFESQNGIEYRCVPADKWATAIHVGPYSTLLHGWKRQIHRVMKMTEYQTQWLPLLEIYRTTQLPSGALHETELCVPLQPAPPKDKG